MKVFYLYFTINLINNCFFYFRTFFHLSAFFCMNRDLEPSILRWHLSTACIRFMFFVGKIFLFLLFFLLFFLKGPRQIVSYFRNKTHHTSLTCPYFSRNCVIVFPPCSRIFYEHEEILQMLMLSLEHCFYFIKFMSYYNTYCFFSLSEKWSNFSFGKQSLPYSIFGKSKNFESSQFFCSIQFTTKIIEKKYETSVSFIWNIIHRPL